MEKRQIDVGAIISNLVSTAFGDDGSFAAYFCLGRKDILVESIQRWAKSSLKYARLAAMNASIGRPEVPFEVIMRGMDDEWWPIRSAAAQACEGRELPLETIADWASSHSEIKNVASMYASVGHPDVPLDIIKDLLMSPHHSGAITEPALKALRSQNPPLEFITKWAESMNLLNQQRLKMLLCVGRPDVPVSIIEEGIRSDDSYILEPALMACENRHDVSDIIVQRIETVKIAGNDTLLAKACQGQDIPIATIAKWVDSRQLTERMASMYASVGRPEVPLEIIKKGLDPKSSVSVRIAALEACRGRPDLTLKDFEFDFTDHPRYAWDLAPIAYSVCRELGIYIPVSRDFEPEGHCYFGCQDNTTVEVEIPKDAHVRRGPGKRCRASKVIIKDISHGGFHGSKLAVSMSNRTISSTDDTVIVEDSRGKFPPAIYSVGDTVIVDDFDLTHPEHIDTTGFDFYVARKEISPLHLI